MKRIVFLVSLILLTSGGVRAQKVTMKIHTRSGEELLYDVDEIKQMTATPSPGPRNRVVVCHEYFGEQSFSSSFNNGVMRFERGSEDVYLWLPTGASIISGPPPQQGPASYCSYLTFHAYARGTNITALNSSDKEPYHVGTAWHDSTIYVSFDKIQKYTLHDSEFTGTEQPIPGEAAGLSIEVNDSGTKLAFASAGSSWSHTGKLVELDIVSGKIENLTTDDRVNSVRYLPGSDDVVYYSYGSFKWDGDRQPKDAGYFKLDRSTGIITQLLNFVSSMGGEEPWNGFDISHDGKKLVIPNARGAQNKPELYEFDIATGAMDTLPVQFTLPPSYNSLWAQYNSNDSLILFSLSDIHASVMRLAGGQTEAGIYDRTTGMTQELLLSPTNSRGFCAPYPRWSPDDKAICYGGCVIPVYYFEWIAPFFLYIKKL